MSWTTPHLFNQANTFDAKLRVTVVPEPLYALSLQLGVGPSCLEDTGFDYPVCHDRQKALARELTRRLG